MIARLIKKITRLDSKVLSQVQRLTLCKILLQNLPIYHLVITNLIKSHLLQMETCIKIFLWGQIPNQRNIHLISWRNLTKPLKQGRMGFIQLEPFNKALLEKKFWRIILNPSSLIRQDINQNYGKGYMENIDQAHYKRS